MATSSSSCPERREKKHWWWLSKHKIAENYVREARCLIATWNHTDIALAINILDSALLLSPTLDLAMELKARSLIYLRRFKEIADMLQDYIPSLSLRFDEDDDSSMSSGTGTGTTSSPPHTDQSLFKCFSISDLKKNKIFTSLSNKRGGSKEGQWRYLVLGQACFHLGLMEDAMLLLLTGKRLAAEAFRQESISWTEDNFYLSVLQTYDGKQKPPLPPKTESETISQLLSNVKFLIRRKTAAVAALHAGLHSEAVRHLTKLVEGRRNAPQGFLILVECYVHRASAYKSLGRIAEAIADCNKALALDPTSMEALSIRASLFETIGCFIESLQDLEQMKLLYNSILSDGRLPGPAWKPQTVQCREVIGRVCCLTTKIQKLKQRGVSSVGESGNIVDYNVLMGLRRDGCSRSEIERAQLLLSLRHKPEKAIGFLDRVELGEEGDMESVRDRAKTSALWLYRLIQKGYSSLTEGEEEAAMKKKEKNGTSWCLQQALTSENSEPENSSPLREEGGGESKQIIIITKPGHTIQTVMQGGLCRDLENLISEAAGFSHPFETLSC
ncbi:uncharacterized protein LOC124921362 [Impatiens glandulifera]|uniref:uncharacterized protein LOC124921362 n=1 Tax=Impatiens glandulifera TaxID=253017 RepID=UPI001FB08D58|nr:uncharacterized protein LOC124921362 [Impatiens glandulifera]